MYWPLRQETKQSLAPGSNSIAPLLRHVSTLSVPSHPKNPELLVHHPKTLVYIYKWRGAPAGGEVVEAKHPLGHQHGGWRDQSLRGIILQATTGCRLWQSGLHQIFAQSYLTWCAALTFKRDPSTASYNKSSIRPSRPMKPYFAKL